MTSRQIDAHRKETKNLAKALKWPEVYHWLVEHGYFPESYVLPPCFKVTRRPPRPRLFSKVKGNKGKKKFSPALTPRTICSIHFPKTDLTDRTFGRPPHCLPFSPSEPAHESGLPLVREQG